ncbi:hypothetical protein E2C01_006376 [Portunus trituberculatus]|uniref:Uncharacterized protein n=1 Tax=Portunus trituberculatus TaxID=210409 RepID=A0A5B7CZ66_PORTR|nr:hypothetical protein [Portunus trituberculatus]
MNWVGGVRRRVLQRDEVQRRQDLFFAAHALPAQQSASRNTLQVPAEGSQASGSTHSMARLSSGSLAGRTRISPRKWRNDDLKQSETQDSHVTDLQPGRKGHTKAAKKASKTSLPPVRPASIHGPFSRYLLKLELQSVGLKLDEEEKLRSSEKQGPQSRAKGQKKERDSRDGRLARKSTAPDRSRDKISKQPLSQDETAKDNPELQDTRTSKKHTSSKDIAFHLTLKTSKSNVLKHCDEGNTDHWDKEVRRRGYLNNIPKERNKHLSRKTPKSTQSCKAQRITGHTSGNVYGSQANVQTKRKNITDSSPENTVHKEEHQCNTINAKAYTANSKEYVEANKSLKNSDWRQQEQKSNKRDKEGKHSKRTRKASSLLDGAPRLRQVLSLTPERHKGRIWAPLYLPNTESPSKGKQNMAKNVNQVNTDNGQEKQKVTDSREKYRTLHKPSTSKIQREWEEARLAMLLGTQFKSSSNNDKDKQEDENNVESNNTAEIRSDYQLTQNSLNPPSPYDKADKAGENHMSFYSPDTQQANREIPDTRVSETPKRDDHDSQRPKLSSYTRTIYKIESGLSFARERKDKTPYLDRSFGTPWLGGPIFDTSGSSFSSSKTPTDPTLERSCEDPIGSQGTELHLNTTVRSIITAHYQDQGKEIDETQATIKESGINQSQNHLFNRQYISKEACSPLLVLGGYENVKHNGGTWMVYERYADLVTDPHQLVTHHICDENKSLDSLYSDSHNSHWLGAHENKTLQTQHQFACQYEGSTEGTSDSTNPSATHTQVPLNNVCKHDHWSGYKSNHQNRLRRHNWNQTDAGQLAQLEGNVYKELCDHHLILCAWVHHYSQDAHQGTDNGKLNRKTNTAGNTGTEQPPGNPHRPHAGPAVLRPPRFPAPRQ